MAVSSAVSPSQTYDAVVVGAGFAGMYMLHRLRDLGLAARVYEAGDGVGGTWYWNRYPGARCDVESMEYSYQFSDELQQEWHWSERYAPQPEILAYANHVADRFDLRRDIQFGTRVVHAHFADDVARWNISTDQGDNVSARFCILATGCLSSRNIPDFDGMADFQGDVYHTGNWPHDGVDFTGRRVGVIGTGSSAIQSIPVIAEQAEQLIVFQRTPNYSVPARNAPLDPEYERTVKKDYASFRAENAQGAAAIRTRPTDLSALEVSDSRRREIYEERWQQGGLPFMASFNDLALLPEANATAAEFVRDKIRSIVNDAETAALLSPTNVFGCKRLCVDSGYYATFNRDNVTLVDVSKARLSMSAKAVHSEQRKYEVDTLVLATGFDAMTGAINRIDIRGRSGEKLVDKWMEGPKAYLGLSVVGFPNLFTITGPGSPSVLANMIVAIEQHVDWIHDCIAYMQAQGASTVEAEPDAQDQWVAHVNELASFTLYTTGCNSWYQGANIPGKPRVFMPYLGFPTYVEKCEQVVANGYEGFRISVNPSGTESLEPRER